MFELRIFLSGFSMTYYGSKGSSEDDLSAYYCKYNDKWYLLMN